MNLKCGKCQKVIDIEKFGYKKDDVTLYRRCISCRKKENNTYIHTKKSFLDNYPKLAEEWDWEKNNENKLYPENLSKGSRKRVFWLCSSKNPCHRWESTINSRTCKKPTGCPFCLNQKICPCGCNSVWMSNPELREEWDDEKNSNMKLYAPSSGIYAWWKCKSGNSCHKWKSCISTRTRTNPRGCPFCSNKKICPCGCNSLWMSNPELREEWDEKKNGSMKLYAPSSYKVVWWLCKSKNLCHNWKCKIDKRTCKKPTGCPFCLNQKICPCGCNSLWMSNPELREEWDEKKNGSMKLYAPCGNKIVWWVCASENPLHKWKSTVANRTKKNGTGCPFCNKSKLEKCFSAVCTKLNIEYMEQKKYEDTKNIKALPYDFFLLVYNTLIELQGLQHFRNVPYFYKTKEDFISRIKMDLIKVLTAHKRNQSFLSVSYLCCSESDIEFILNKFISDKCNSPLIRFYITKDIYIQPFSTSISIPNDNQLLSVFQIYDIQVKAIESSLIPEINLSYCPYCEDYYLENYMQFHFRTKDHYLLLQEKYQNLVGMYENGVPIILME